MTKLFKENKKIIFISSFVLLGITTLFICLFLSNKNNTYDDSPISYISCSYIIDVYDINAVIGDADYAFIGKVDKIIGTEYKFPVKTEKGTVSAPYTNYSVTVLENIKGELTKNTPITVQKSGGLSEDGKTYCVFEDDFLLNEGKTYVFFAYAQPDGSLLVSGANSNILIANVNEKTDITKTDEYKKVSNSFKNQKESKREHRTAKYDISYKSN
ncbi:MAG: hypothetical protein EOM05_01180 [Clostridia bacterium]|nr:hypothetical protein [Clostridia bacterium]